MPPSPPFVSPAVAPSPPSPLEFPVAPLPLPLAPPVTREPAVPPSSAPPVLVAPVDPESPPSPPVVDDEPDVPPFESSEDSNWFPPHASGHATGTNSPPAKSHKGRTFDRLLANAHGRNAHSRTHLANGRSLEAPRFRKS
jgi:hypothetical protein